LQLERRRDATGMSGVGSVAAAKFKHTKISQTINKQNKNKNKKIKIN
jgi:hypothetical protein